ncbi:phage holin family protein [Luteolibacter flavescens]|uniref:Phage holin family protein n=1 Tax=Luteolibacter flavescens TaxID=1859460 RepID=A0ABT3FR11_9BACT|nr:phage holin family protein [Luteolibacter flavescens]MCW1886018.1 phage holin family protein [Luteolibacter flavescens]
METPERPGPPEGKGLNASVGDFVSLRLRLVLMEAGDAAKTLATKAAAAAAIAVMAIIAWMLFVAGVVGWLAVATTAPWYLLSMLAGGVHVIIAGGLALYIRRAAAPAFPLTRNELTKDKEWLSRLKKPRH